MSKVYKTFGCTSSRLENLVGNYPAGWSRRFGLCRLEDLVHRIGGEVSHVLYPVAVQIQRDRYGFVAEQRLDELRVDILHQEQGGAGMAQIVETDAREVRPPEQGFEGAIDDVLGIEGSSRPRSEH